MIPSTLLLIASCYLGAAEKPAIYARPELLVEAADLAKQVTDRSVRILDCRGKGKYLDGHIPGALYLDAIGWMRAFGDGEDREGWQKRIGALGIDTDKKVVVYDDSRAKDAARVWWILRYWGIRDVRLLNGGWAAWAAQSAPMEKAETKAKAIESRLQPQEGRLASKSFVASQIGGKAQIVDARSAEEYCGTAPTAKRNGAIPGALHLEWSDTVDRDGRFKSAEELTKIFREAGIDPLRPAITYCQSGGRASVMAFALELMGGKDVRNYYRSWAEWGNAEDTPISKPRPK
jgi:thiosulfate/3-mercaptopyruvate sulfurtransferase